MEGGGGCPKDPPELRKSSSTRQGGWRQGFSLPWDDSRIPKKPSVKAERNLSPSGKTTVGKVPPDEIIATLSRASRDRMR